MRISRPRRGWERFSDDKGEPVCLKETGNGNGDLLELLRVAEKEMYKDKSDYYVQTGKDRRK